jgi:hypothetical protein
MGNVLKGPICSNCMGKLWYSVILIREAVNFVSRGAITGFQCICIKNKTILYLVVIENKSFTFVILFEAFVMKVQFKLVTQNISQIC